jgi:hypothetical protein
MRCPKCGNTIGQNEVFCGQCGAPNPAQLPLPAENNFPSPTRGHQQPEQPGPYNAHTGMGPASFGPPRQSPHNPQTSPLPENASMAQHIPPQPARVTNHLGQYTPQQQGNFYRDATEAMNLPPDVRGLGTYASSSSYAPSQLSSHGGQYNSYAQQPFVTGQQYQQGTRIQSPQLPQKQPHNPIMIVVSICSIVVILGAAITGGFILFKDRDAQVQKTAPAVAVTRTVTLTYTPTPAASPTQVPTPSPTIAPTPTPDPGFVWCGQLCTASNFTTEYPGTWQAGTTSTTNAIQFVNPVQTDQYAIFKGQGPTVSDAGTLANNELQTSYATQPGYTAPTSTSAATISGETWIKAIAYYQGASQQEEVEVLATVHGSKSYIIDLNAPSSQFATVNEQTFGYMIGKLQFTTA